MFCECSHSSFFMFHPLGYLWPFDRICLSHESTRCHGWPMNAIMMSFDILPRLMALGAVVESF
jgi:hypothetical protein